MSSLHHQLRIAAAERDRELAHRLCLRGAKPHAFGNGWNAFLLAINNHDACMLQTLLPFGDPNASSRLGAPLMFACERAEIACALALFPHCDPWARQSDGQDALAKLRFGYGFALARDKTIDPQALGALLDLFAQADPDAGALHGASNDDFGRLLAQARSRAQAQALRLHSRPVPAAGVQRI